MPLLLLAPICSTIAEASGIGINISEKSYLNIVHYVFGIAANLVLACILVPLFGLVGAVLSVAISSLIVLAIRSYLGGKYYASIESTYRTCMGALLLFAGAVLSYVFCGTVLQYICPAILLLVLCVVFRDDVSYLLDIAKTFFRRTEENER